MDSGTRAGMVREVTGLLRLKIFSHKGHEGPLRSTKVPFKTFDSVSFWAAYSG